MNKMAKGALATGVGVALLLGGGGTLAVWNDTQAANAGTIAAGDLDLNAGQGIWKNTAGVEITDIAGYRIVPGETLTFTQPVDLTLVGKEMKATLTIGGYGDNTFKGTALPTVTVMQKGKELQGAGLTEANDGEAIATAVFKFDPNTSTDSRMDANAKIDLTKVGYTLQQVAP